MTLFALLTAQLNHRNPIAPQPLRVWDANPAGRRRECNRLPCRYHLHLAHGLLQPLDPNVFGQRVHRKHVNTVSPLRRAKRLLSLDWPIRAAVDRRRISIRPVANRLKALDKFRLDLPVRLRPTSSKQLAPVLRKKSVHREFRHKFG